MLSINKTFSTKLMNEGNEGKPIKTSPSHRTHSLALTIIMWILRAHIRQHMRKHNWLTIVPSAPIRNLIDNAKLHLLAHLCFDRTKSYHGRQHGYATIIWPFDVLHLTNWQLALNYQEVYTFLPRKKLNHETTKKKSQTKGRQKADSGRVRFRRRTGNNHHIYTFTQ